jgi:pimeloyl-ACP methyl ester carboxylesterase
MGRSRVTVAVRSPHDPGTRCDIVSNGPNPSVRVPSSSTPSVSFAAVTWTPPVLYAQSGGVHIAHQVVGEGGLDLVLVQGFASHLDVEWENPAMARFFRGLASFSRLIRFDKRGFGLSDRNVAPVPLEERMDDVRAVMDAVGSERAVLMGISEGVPMSILFAATYPERTQALVLYGGMARATEAPGYPWGPSAEGFVQASEELIMPLVYTGGDIDAWAPSLDEDPAAREWLGRYRRAAMSPDGIEAVIKMFLDIDVRHVLSTLHVPTLVLHRHGDRVVNWRASQWMADAGSSYRARITFRGPVTPTPSWKRCGRSSPARGSQRSLTVSSPP